MSRNRGTTFLSRQATSQACRRLEMMPVDVSGDRSLSIFEFGPQLGERSARRRATRVRFAPLSRDAHARAPTAPYTLPLGEKFTTSVSRTRRDAPIRTRGVS